MYTLNWLQPIMFRFFERSVPIQKEIPAGVTLNPVAKTGSSQTTFVGATVSLNGSATEPGGTGVSGYSWAQLSGPATSRFRTLPRLWHTLSQPLPERIPLP